MVAMGMQSIFLDDGMPLLEGGDFLPPSPPLFAQVEVLNIGAVNAGPPSPLALRLRRSVWLEVVVILSEASSEVSWR